MSIVTNFSELLEKTHLVWDKQGMPILQEYIPGRKKKPCHILLDKNGGVKVLFCTEYLRTFFRVSSNAPTAEEVTAHHPYVKHATRLLQNLGWWGGVSVETKIDARDGCAKLMEINPRLGYRLWNRTEVDINMPLIYLQIARGEQVEPAKINPNGVILLDPVEDLAGIFIWLADLMAYKYRVVVRAKMPLDPLNRPMTIRERIHSYKQTYFEGQDKVFNPYFRYFFQDPLVSIIWWFQFLFSALREKKQLGK